jgi:hypothetical protein
MSDRRIGSDMEKTENFSALSMPEVGNKTNLQKVTEAVLNLRHGKVNTFHNCGIINGIF